MMNDTIHPDITEIDPPSNLENLQYAIARLDHDELLQFVDDILDLQSVVVCDKMTKDEVEAFTLMEALSIFASEDTLGIEAHARHTAGRSTRDDLGQECGNDGQPIKLGQPQ